MNFLKGFFKYTLLLIIFVGATIFIFVSTSPQFGRAPEGERLARVEASPQYQDGTFVNAIHTSMDMSVDSIVSTLKEFIGAENTRPDQPLPVDFSKNTPDTDSLVHVTWFGHSAVLLEIEGKRILLDPMLGPSASPVPFFAKRFAYREPIDFSQFVNIDAVVISHDHYDHLDYGSIQKLNPNVGHFYVPLGVGGHLERWGVDSAKITELDWWESASAEGITFTATPQRHFSGRGLTDRNSTLWASWVVEGLTHKVYFSGDGGYGPHFKQIGQRFGPFDLAMIECGQYNVKWKDIHLMPEQTMQAFLDLEAKVLMPIHWGAFNLAVHPWTESVERLNRANKSGAFIATPGIGARYPVGTRESTSKWWESLAEF
ncbi:MBL fold metallo-hydrolase [Persicitalea jodogahamensis]|uniref:Membrane protein n=1 Tax=Persicitalea jodogahamensis TaxID=402147 RepID=A0A8J3GA57_9BACT|nr:MBL fold metallo-hydrolase [Persicitalea jodogahamensis]GHB78285.1 membrane protein [Persicitalea jodogahamensis]